MTHPNGAESRSVDERIAELNVELETILRAKAAKAVEEKKYRAKEDAKKRISFAREIFALQHDQLRLNVEAEFVRKKIMRLQLGYAEDAVPMGDTPKGFVL
ncbi:MAG: hypothetical protein AB7E32_16700 [Desulfovibrio sp.]